MNDKKVGNRSAPDSIPTGTPGETNAPSDAHPAPPGSAEHRENQEELGVGPDHLTEDMQRRHRGTFP